MTKRLLLAAALLALSGTARSQSALDALKQAAGNAEVSAPAAAGAPAAGQRAILFSDWLDRHPDDLWSSDAPAATRKAVAAYNRRKKLRAGLHYGDSIRGLALGGLRPEQIDVLLKSRGFTRHDDVIRDSKKHQPVLDAGHQPIPMIVYTHPDGGMVRLKPVGDPTFKLRPQPDVIKSVRNPPDGDYRDFSLEAFKIEAGGDRAIPKSPRELKNPYHDTPLADGFVDGWGDAAHADVRAQPAAAAR